MSPIGHEACRKFVGDALRVHVPVYRSTYRYLAHNKISISYPPYGSKAKFMRTSALFRVTVRRTMAQGAQYTVWS